MDLIINAIVRADVMIALICWCMVAGKSGHEKGVDANKEDDEEEEEFHPISEERRGANQLIDQSIEGEG